MFNELHLFRSIQKKLKHEKNCLNKNKKNLDPKFAPINKYYKKNEHKKYKQKIKKFQNKKKIEKITEPSNLQQEMNIENKLFKSLSNNQTYGFVKGENSQIQIHLDLQGISMLFKFYRFDKSNININSIHMKEEEDTDGLLMILDEFYLKADLYLKEIKDWKISKAFQKIWEYLRSHPGKLVCSNKNISPIYGMFGV
jgi:hypothetical protein